MNLTHSFILKFYVYEGNKIQSSTFFNKIKQFEQKQQVKKNFCFFVFVFFLCVLLQTKRTRAC